MRVYAIAAMLVAGSLCAAHADMAQFDPHLKSKKSVCCNEFDGRPPEAVWELHDGPNSHYRVMIEGTWVNVPDDAVLDVPNKYGTAVVWYSVTRGMIGPDGKPTSSYFIRCFLPGELI